MTVSSKIGGVPDDPRGMFKKELIPDDKAGSRDTKNSDFAPRISLSKTRVRPTRVFTHANEGKLRSPGECVCSNGQRILYILPYRPRSPVENYGLEKTHYA